MSLESHISRFSNFLSIYPSCGGNGEIILFLDDAWWGDQPLRSQFPDL